MSTDVACYVSTWAAPKIAETVTFRGLSTAVYWLWSALAAAAAADDDDYPVHGVSRIHRH